MSITDKIKALLKNRVVPHAIIIESADAESAVRLITQAAVCSSADKPCGECEMCKKAADLNHADIKIYRGDGTAKPYPVDLIRDIRMDAFIKPNEAEKKVYVLDKADNMSPQAQNALLKVFEEPPEFAVFVITCKNKSTLLDTILSRAVIFSEYLDEKSDEKILLTAHKIVEAMVAPYELELLKLCYDLSSDKDALRNTLSELQNVFRNIYLEKSGVSTAVAVPQSSVLTVQNAVDAIDAAEQIKNAITRNANNSLNATRMCALLRAAVGK
ncbi:MAG: hypothetical protein IJF54_04090 [Clostridia bacterium]|nr:hypothetical protein [Clostridia bacterium]